MEWIVTAKREDTRKERVKGTVERLGKNGKIPEPVSNIFTILLLSLSTFDLTLRSIIQCLL
ncbi:MAG: YdeI/OmpD-associated family protein [Saprospiraceae bacterium]|nr:YdeI/OmpD-associated family protein [Saprospiraceae bacterium]